MMMMVMMILTIIKTRWNHVARVHSRIPDTHVVDVQQVSKVVSTNDEKCELESFTSITHLRKVLRHLLVREMNYPSSELFELIAYIKEQVSLAYCCYLPFAFYEPAGVFSWQTSWGFSPPYRVTQLGLSPLNQRSFSLASTHLSGKKDFVRGRIFLAFTKIHHKGWCFAHSRTSKGNYSIKLERTCLRHTHTSSPFPPKTPRFQQSSTSRVPATPDLPQSTPQYDEIWRSFLPLPPWRPCPSFGRFVHSFLVSNDRNEWRNKYTQKTHTLGNPLMTARDINIQWRRAREK